MNEYTQILPHSSILFIRIFIAIVLTALAITDDLIRYKISNRLVLSGLLAGIILLGLDLIIGETISIYITGAGVTFGLLIGIYIIRGIGAGDVKFLTVLGFCLGFKIISRILFWTFLSAGVIGFIRLLLRGGRLVAITVPYRGQVKGHAFHFTLAILLGEMLTIIQVFVSR